MKKLGKLKLHDTVVMSDSELKHVFGGMEPTTEPGGTGTTGGDVFENCSSFTTEESCKGNCFTNSENGTGRGKCNWHSKTWGSWCGCD